jgi:hypothetical protein
MKVHMVQNKKGRFTKASHVEKDYTRYAIWALVLFDVAISYGFILLTYQIK